LILEEYSMFGVHSGVAFHAPVLSHGAASVSSPRARGRQLAQLASGRRRGPITRLITPWDIGKQTSPFVSLEYVEANAGLEAVAGLQSRSGTPTLVAVLGGRVLFEHANGTRGEVNAGSCAWMPASHVTWRAESGVEQPLRVFQAGISLSGNQQTVPAVSDDAGADDTQEPAPIRVILGQFGRTQSRLGSFAADINLFHVSLKDGEVWRYCAPEGHNVTWLAVERGGLELSEGRRVYWEQIGVFDEAAGLIEVQADGDTSFLLGSARKDPR
jgi:redox-sensitive bicupin YhaK (pirin superfamily)